MDNDWTQADAAQLAVSEEEFRKAWDLVNAVAAGDVVPLKSPSERGTVSIEDEGRVTTYRFTNTPYVREMFAVRDLFGRENPKWMACHLRLDAVTELFEEPRMERWIQDIDGLPRVFDGVIAAAATVPLRHGEEEGWHFKADEFFPIVEAIHASGKYNDTGEVW